jgi:hypothetical protein
MIIISRWSIPAHILLKKKGTNPEGNSDRGNKEKEKREPKSKKWNYSSCSCSRSSSSFLFPLCLLLLIIFWRSFQVFLLCLFVCFLVVWVSNSAGQLVPLL